MKKLLSLAVALGLALSLAACGGGTTTDESPAPATDSPAASTETAAPESETPSYEPATVRVAYMPNLGSAGSLFVGIEQGYFEEVGLTVEPFEFQGGPAEIAAMASGDIDLCMLPVPAATTVMMQNSDVRDAIDLNGAWTESGAQGTFTMGCLVARTEWLEGNSELVPGILEEYAASIDYANSNPEEAAALIEQYGIVPKAAVAQAAIPQANMVCVTGEDMKGIADYYQVLFDADPTSIGGAIPGEDFYYIP